VSKKLSGRQINGTDWYGNCYRQGFKNLGATPMVGKFDAVELVKYWKDTGAEVVFMNAFFKSYSLYPSKLTVIDPNLNGRDLVKEFCNACKKHGMKSAAYLQTQNHWPFMVDRPEWNQTRTDGTLYGGAPVYSMEPAYWQACYNSPYIDKMAELIHETLSLYHFDAAFIDETYNREGICHCPFCKDKFRKKYGVELPLKDDISDPVYRKAMEFKYDSFRGGIMRCVDAIRAENPDIAIVLNDVSGHCHWCSGHGEQLTEEIDYPCAEYVHGASSLDKLGYAHDTSVACAAYHVSFLRGKSGRNRKVHAYNYVVEPGSQSRMDIDIGLELKSAMAFGGVPAIQGERKILKDLFGYFKKCEPYLLDTEPVQYIGVLASQRSADTHNFQLGIPSNYYGDLKGAFNSILDLKLPGEFISGRTLESGRIDKLSVIVLSDVGFLTGKQLEVLRKFVRNGGALIATHQSSLIGEDSKPLANFALSDVFGVKAAGEVKKGKQGFVLFDNKSEINQLLEMPRLTAIALVHDRQEEAVLQALVRLVVSGDLLVMDGNIGIGHQSR